MNSPNHIMQTSSFIVLLLTVTCIQSKTIETTSIEFHLNASKIGKICSNPSSYARQEICYPKGIVVERTKNWREYSSYLKGGTVETPLVLSSESMV